MKRKIFISLIFIYSILLLTATAFFISWKIDLNMHINMTEKYGYEFESFEVHKTPGEVWSLKVLDYSSTDALVYYHFKGDEGSKFIEYENINGEWKIKKCLTY